MHWNCVPGDIKITLRFNSPFKAVLHRLPLYKRLECILFRTFNPYKALLEECPAFAKTGLVNTGRH